MTAGICAGTWVMEPLRYSQPDIDCLVEYSPAVIAICASPYAAIRRIRCYVLNGVARLEGRLPTYHQKQIAQEIVRRTPGVDMVDNRIVVESNFQSTN